MLVNIQLHKASYVISSDTNERFKTHDNICVDAKWHWHKKIKNSDS